MIKKITRSVKDFYSVFYNRYRPLENEPKYILSINSSENVAINRINISSNNSFKIFDIATGVNSVKLFNYIDLSSDSDIYYFYNLNLFQSNNILDSNDISSNSCDINTLKITPDYDNNTETSLEIKEDTVNINSTLEPIVIENENNDFDIFLENLENTPVENLKSYSNILVNKDEYFFINDSNISDTDSNILEMDSNLTNKNLSELSINTIDLNSCGNIKANNGQINIECSLDEKNSSFIDGDDRIANLLNASVENDKYIVDNSTNYKIFYYETENFVLTPNNENDFINEFNLTKNGNFFNFGDSNKNIILKEENIEGLNFEILNEDNICVSIYSINEYLE